MIKLFKRIDRFGTMEKPSLGNLPFKQMFFQSGRTYNNLKK